MNSVTAFFKAHWKKLLGGAVAVAGSFFPEVALPAQVLGGVILGSDFQVGSSIGTPVGQAAKRVADTHKALSQDELMQLAAQVASKVLADTHGEVGSAVERLQALAPRE